VIVATVAGGATVTEVGRAIARPLEWEARKRRSYHRR
jgi:hypothetical protein